MIAMDTITSSRVNPWFSPQRHGEHRDLLFAHREMPMGKQNLFLGQERELLTTRPVSRQESVNPFFEVLMAPVALSRLCFGLKGFLDGFVEGPRCKARKSLGVRRT
jgi:hypothetical protein